MHLCKGTRAKESTHEFELQFLKKFQRENDILSLDAEENKKAKRRKRNAQVAQESDKEEEEDDCSVLSECAPDDEEESGEEEEVDVVNEEQIGGLLGSHSGLFVHKTFSSALHLICLST